MLSLLSLCIASCREYPMAFGHRVVDIIKGAKGTAQGQPQCQRRFRRLWTQSRVSGMQIVSCGALLTSVRFTIIFGGLKVCAFRRSGVL